MGPETGGKLALDTSLGNPVFNFNESATNLILSARANSNINPANLTLGLKSDDTFAVVGIYDLILPTPPRERYGIRLTDVAMGVEASDIIEISVVRRLDNTVAIQFRHIDDLGNTVTVVDEVLLDPAHDQVQLSLARNSTLNNSITASFAYIDGGIAGPTTTFGNTTTIFNGENFTRAEFRTILRVEADVPEPSILLLLGSGLIGWGVLAHRRRRSAT